VKQGKRYFLQLQAVNFIFRSEKAALLSRNKPVRVVDEIYWAYCCCSGGRRSIRHSEQLIGSNQQMGAVAVILKASTLIPPGSRTSFRRVGLFMLQCQ